MSYLKVCQGISPVPEGNSFPVFTKTCVLLTALFISLWSQDSNTQRFTLLDITSKDLCGSERDCSSVCVLVSKEIMQKLKFKRCSYNEDPSLLFTGLLFISYYHIQ